LHVTEQPADSYRENIMKENENWYSSEIRPLLCKERYSTTSHHYFFELKEAKNGSKYIVIDQRRKIGNEFVGTKMRLFADEMLEFQRILNKLIHLAVHDVGISPPVVSSPTASSAPTGFDEGHHIPVCPRAGLFEKAKSQFQRLWGRSQTQNVQSDLQPGFFEKLTVTENWQEFEEYTYYLLKLAGIQTVYHFLGERQAGKADGFFKTGNLAVLYDCTLRAGQVELDKQEQIKNYCYQLQQGSIDLSDNIKEEFYHHHKQIWIITKGISRQIKVINTIEVKEIGIADIIHLYKERLTGNMSHQTIEMRLQNL